MKKIVAILLLIPSFVFADINVTPGTGKTVATTTDNSREFQNVVVSTIQINNAAGVSLPVGYATGNSSVPVSVQNFPASQAVTGTFFPAVQPVSGGVTIVQPGSEVLATSGTITGPLPSGTNAIGSITNTSFGAIQPNAYNVISTNTIVSTGAVTAAQGPAGSSAWPTIIIQPGSEVLATSGTITAALPSGTNNLGTFTGSSVTIFSPNNNTTPIPITGNISVASVNTTTATPNTALPIAGVEIGGVGPTGLFQSFAVTASSAIQISGSLSTTGGAQSIVDVTGSTNSVGYKVGTASVPVNVLNTVPVTGTFFQGTQPISGTVAISTGGVSVKFDGTQNVQIQTGANVIGSISNTAFAISTGGVTAVLSGAVPSGTNGIGSVIVSTGGVTAVLSGAVPAGTNGIGSVIVSTGGITAAQGGTWTVQPGNTPNTAPWIVAFPDGQPVTSTSTQITVLYQPTVIGATVTFPSPQAVIITTGGVSSQQLLLVSSNTTLPAQVNDGLRVSAMADNEGRIVTQAGVPTSVYLTTSPTTASAGYMVLVASPAASLFTHMCGCIFANTSATGVTANLYPSGVITTTNTPTLYLPPTDNRGIWPGCDKPFLNTTAGGVQVTVKISASVSSISGYCQYFQSTSP